MPLAGGLEDGEAVEPGQHEVEHDEIVGWSLDDQVQRALAVGGDLDGVAFLGEALPDEAGDLTLVFGDQDPHVVPPGGHRPLPRIFALRRAGVHAQSRPSAHHAQLCAPR